MAREFAPGIPIGRVIKPIPRVSPKAENQDWDVSLSMHPAAVRGDHLDLRLVDPKGKGHSWAMSKLPEPGQSTYAAQVAAHSKEYSLRDKPWKIPPGYGATRPGKMVEPVYVQKAEVVQASNDKVRFLRHHGQETDEFVLRRVGESKGQPLWTINNATKNRQTREGQKLPSSKPQYKEIRPEQVSFSDVGEVMTPKLDGAHVLVDMKGPNAPMRVYSYRPTERKTGVIEHTFKFPDFHKRTTSPSTKNTLLRAELWASKDGKAIPAEQLGGLLNSGVLKSRAKQQEGNIQLRLTGIDVIKHQGKNYENKDFDEKLRALRTITRGSKGIVEMPLVARTPEEKQQLMKDIEKGKLPETKEGVVLHRVDGNAPPTKVKFKPQDDVYVRDVFSRERGKARGHAGGFAYSVTPDGPIVGRVGTGFNHSTRKDMLDNPDRYIGRVAKVHSQGPYRSGALRAPSFDEWHIDKTPPELMKEGAELYHGSPRRLKQLKPRGEHGDPRVPNAVFGTPSRPFALAYSGKKWGDRDIEQGMRYDENDEPTEMYLREMRPGALKELYSGQRGYLYTLPSEGFEPPPRKGAKWEQINRSIVVPTKTEEIRDVYEALRKDPIVRFHEYDPEALETRAAVQRSIKRMGEMRPKDAKGYKKWRLENAPPEISRMFEEEMSKTSQEDVLGAIKDYKEKAIKEISPDEAVQIARLASRRTRLGAASTVGLGYAKEYLNAKGLLQKHVNKSKRTGLVRGVG